MEKAKVVTILKDPPRDKILQIIFQFVQAN